MDSNLSPAESVHPPEESAPLEGGVLEQAEAQSSSVPAPDEAASETAADNAQAAEATAQDSEAASPSESGERPPVEESTTSSSTDPLTDLADRSQKGRLSAPDEEQATKLVAAALGEGREGLARVVEQLPRLPWIIGVNGVTTAWPELKPAVRNRLLASLARVDTDAARRVRLSLARGLFKLEPAVSGKLAVGVAKEIRDKETGAISNKNAQVFANVLIGRAKPWLVQLPLADLKPAEAEVLVHCALLAVFSLPHTPVTQLGVVKWAAAAGRLAKLQKPVVEAITKGLSRWSGKWQGVLREEVEGLPEEMLAALRPEQPDSAEEEAEQPGKGSRERRDRRVRRSEEASALEGEPDPEEESALSKPPGRSESNSDADADTEADEEDDEDELDREEDARNVAAPTKPRPVYESKTVPPRDRERDRDPRDRERDRKGANFNLGETLRQIDSYVASLRSELGQAQNKLRQREDDSRKNRRPERGSAPLIPGEPSAEELARLNVQLEARNAELQQRIEELAADSEDRAAAAEIASGEPVADEDKRLRQLLTLKLQESYDDFLALESESPDVVAPKHYRTVLGHVFQVLAAEGIFAKAPPVD